MVIKEGMVGFRLTIPWQLHGWMVMRTDFAREYYKEENVAYSKLNSDEYITRLLYLRSYLTVCCEAVYLHMYDNNDSLTRTVKLINYDCLKTMDKLCQLCKSEKTDVELNLSLCNQYFMTFLSMVSSLRFLKTNDRVKAKEMINYYHKYSYRKIVSWSVLKHASLKCMFKLVFSLLHWRIFYLINRIKL